MPELSLNNSKIALFTTGKHNLMNDNMMNFGFKFWGKGFIGYVCSMGINIL